MKRFVTILLVLMMFCTTAFCEGIDFSAMSDEELQSAAIEIQQELVSRNVYTDSIFFPGEYVVGQDIEAGVYEISLLEFSRSDNDRAYLYVYDENDEQLVWEQIKKFDIVLKEKLKNGDVLKLESGNYIVIKIA